MESDTKTKELVDKIKQLVAEWDSEADFLYNKCRTGKWYSSMSVEEQAIFNYYKNTANRLLLCANQLEKLIPA